jgi:hypothetical protein
MTGDPRLFVGVFPGGLSYCDRTREEHGDYVKLAFLPYATLKLEWHRASSNIPRALWNEIKEHAIGIQARRGEAFQVSTTGQTVILGSAA